MVIQSLIGGSIIGIAVSLLLLFNGKVLGVSGILGELFNHPLSKNYWRLFFVLGLLISPLIFSIFHPIPLIEISSNKLLIILGGLLVGFGSRLGSGCTSGHGVCGLARLSVRSFIATMTFIFFGFVTVFVLQKVLI
ncbi:YeeE/YedE family protein [Candidatus Methylopumilus planktonicus]|uniref:YeeE/YedE family protein n=1 Tax=Candidatus Methylopumilus planktonicus TaxID=1581557 RepID=UPI003BEF1846